MSLPPSSPRGSPRARLVDGAAKAPGVPPGRAAQVARPRRVERGDVRPPLLLEVLVERHGASFRRGAGATVAACPAAWVWSRRAVDGERDCGVGVVVVGGPDWWPWWMVEEGGFIEIVLFLRRWAIVTSFLQGFGRATLNRAIRGLS